MRAILLEIDAIAEPGTWRWSSLAFQNTCYLTAAQCIAIPASKSVLSCYSFLAHYVQKLPVRVCVGTMLLRNVECGFHTFCFVRAGLAACSRTANARVLFVFVNGDLE